MELESNGSTPRTPRIRYSCTECHRRKIKCNQIIPCEHCVKKGIQNSCTRARAPTRQPQSPELVQRLLSRVATLEQVVKDQNPVLQEESVVESVSSPTAASIANHSTPGTTNSLLLGQEPQTPGISEAASVLEFLAWGRRKDQEFHEAPELDSGPRRHSITAEEASTTHFLIESTRAPHLELLEILLPSKKHIYQLTEWHATRLLWYHGSYNAVVFREHLDNFFTVHQGSIRRQDVNLQWVALLFAILAGSITCSSEHTAESWGFKDSERSRLSGKWYRAAVTCLNLSDYLETHTIYSVQAITTLTISAHIIGLSNSQSVLLASANRIAQSLGLHRLGEEDATTDPSTQEDIKRRIRRETGRRVWVALCTQDWFSVPFSESYALNSKYFSTGKPLNCNDGNIVVFPPETPTTTSYCNYLYDIAALIPKLQDAITEANTLYTKYEQVLVYDEKMRKLVTAFMPTFLSTQSSVPSNWPVFVPWARRSLAICAAHKIIMIHRLFIGQSFTNSAFAFTRRTCIAASKTILKEAKTATDESGPVLWIDQAFVVAAAITLSLDAFHRAPEEAEHAEHKALTEDAIKYLSQFKLSMIAIRGVKLLSFLVKELSAGNRPSRKRPYSDVNDGILVQGAEKRTRTFNLPRVLQAVSTEMPSTPRIDVDGTSDSIAWEDFEDMFPPQTGFGNELDDFFHFSI